MRFSFVQSLFCSSNLTHFHYERKKSNQNGTEKKNSAPCSLTEWRGPKFQSHPCLVIAKFGGVRGHCQNFAHIASLFCWRLQRPIFLLRVTWRKLCPADYRFRYKTTSAGPTFSPLNPSFRLRPYRNITRAKDKE